MRVGLTRGAFLRGDVRFGGAGLSRPNGEHRRKTQATGPMRTDRFGDRDGRKLPLVGIEPTDPERQLHLGWSSQCTEKALRENPNVSGIYRLRAACLSQLDRVDEAKTALGDFLRLARDANVPSTKAQIPLKRPEDLERYIEALRRAGLRES
jgi:hypothetical protein